MIRIIIELNLQVFGDEDKKKKLNIFTTSKPLTLNTIVYSLDIFHLLVFI